MTGDSLPTRGSLSRAIDICESVDRTGKTREKLIEELEFSPDTVKRDIRTGLRFGFLEESDSGVRATNPGLDVARATQGSDRRKDAIQRIIVKHPVYPQIFESVTPSDGGTKIVAVDVDREIRNRGNELGKETRDAAVTTFLKSLEMAGIGEYKKSWREYPERLEINDQERLTELRSRIQTEPSDSIGSADDAPKSATTERLADKDTSPKTPTDRNDVTPAPKPDASQLSTPAPSTVDTNPQAPSRAASFDITLSLDGTEDPQRIEQLVKAVQQGLTVPGRVIGETERAPSTDEPVAAPAPGPSASLESQTAQSDAVSTEDTDRVQSESDTTTAESQTEQPVDKESAATPASKDETTENSSTADTDGVQTDDDSNRDSEPEGLDRFS